MLLSAPAQGKDSSPIHGSSTRRRRHRCGHDGQRKCVAHMPTAATTTEDSRSNLAENYPHDFTMRHKTFPSGVQTTSARWPMAKGGCVPMPITPGSYWRYELKCPAASAASVVQVCPRGGTYCRSSSQMGHSRGATLLGVYWVPQAVQINASI